MFKHIPHHKLNAKAKQLRYNFFEDKHLTSYIPSF